MPLIEGKDEKGYWVKWGKSGKKYYGKDRRKKALAQAKAIRSTGWKEKE